MTDDLICARCGCYRSAHGEDERCEPVGWTFTAMTDRAAIEASGLASLEEEKRWHTLEDAPNACHVLAVRFDEAFGEWIYGVVLSPPSNPFTNWRMLPEPPALSAGVRQNVR
jgi:hypothetical protein